MIAIYYNKVNQSTGYYHHISESFKNKPLEMEPHF